MNEKELRIASSSTSACGLGSRPTKEEMQPEESALASADASADYDEPLDFSSRREEDSADAVDPIERKISRDSGISIGYSNGAAAAAAAGKRPADCYSPVAAAGDRQQRRLLGSSRSPSPCSLSGDSDRVGAAGAGSRLGGGDPYMNPSLAAIPGAMFPGFPAFFAHGLHPGLASPGHGIWPMAAAAAAVNPLAAAALIQDQRKLMSAAAAAAAAVAGGCSSSSSNGGKAAANGPGAGVNARPFKQYRDSLNVPLGYYPMPPFLHMQGMAESAAMAQMIKTQSDELLNLYRQQLGVLDGPDKQQPPLPPSQQQHRKSIRDASAGPAATAAAAVATVSPPTPMPAVGGSGSCGVVKRQVPSPAAAALNTVASAVVGGESQVAGVVATEQPLPSKSAKTAASAVASPPGNPVSPPAPQLASSSLIVAAPSAMTASMSSASSTHSSMSSDGESFSEAPTRASPSSGLVAPLPTSTTGLSSSSQPSSSSRKRSMRTLPTEQKDDAYWERRRKNNEAAKRSRDARRAKEDEIAIRAAFLEQENLRLRVDLAAARQEVEKLRTALVAQQTSNGSDVAS